MNERFLSPPDLTHRLGSGLVASAGVGNKGAMLDRGAQAGLPVPPGYVLLDAAWQQVRKEALVAVHGTTVVAAAPEALLARLHLPSLAGMVAVRSAFAVADRMEESLAGFFTSRLWVDLSDTRQLVTALCDVWASALRLPEAVRRDVLIMRMVPAAHAGVAFSEQDFEDDLVNYTTGTAEHLVAGQVAGTALSLPKLRAVSAARQTIHTMLRRTEQAGTNFTECVATLRWLYTTLVTAMLSLTAAMSVPLFVLRAASVLAEHSARQQTVGTAMFIALESLPALAARQATVREACQRGQLPTDPVFGQLWEQFLAIHGHRGVYESDIAQPRLHEAPQALLASLIHPGSAKQPSPPRSLRGVLTLPLWWHAGRTMSPGQSTRAGSPRLRVWPG